MKNKIEFKLTERPHIFLQNLCGNLNSNLEMIEKNLDVEILNRGTLFSISGNKSNIAKVVIETLYRIANEVIPPEKTHLVLREKQNMSESEKEIVQENKIPSNDIKIPTKKGIVQGRGENQKDYLKRIMDNDINFGVGPAGTGKTYLAVAAAVSLLNDDSIRKIILVRPAVEAGERLGFLPGDLIQKVDPYLRPLYDALYEMLGAERANKYIEKGIIEIAPLAYMRGRTLSDAFIILDEAQNTTIEQMKMFLTRIGFGSKAVVTGDLSQTDLPHGVRSGLKDAVNVLKDIKGLSFTYFKPKDVVRHRLVQLIVEAYEKKNSDKVSEYKTNEKEND